MRLLAAIALIIAPVPAQAPAASTAVIAAEAEPSPYFLDATPVVQVFCDSTLGTAFYVGNGIFVTANHVLSSPKCYVNGVVLTVMSRGGSLNDYAFFHASIVPDFREIISCDGFIEGRTYYATGYAAGHRWPVTQRLRGSSYQSPVRQQWNGTMVLRGAVTSGMSGGPVTDEDGLVVGIVSARAVEGATQALILSLSDTPLCKK